MIWKKELQRNFRSLCRKIVSQGGEEEKKEKKQQQKP